MSHLPSLEGHPMRHDADTTTTLNLAVSKWVRRPQDDHERQAQTTDKAKAKARKARLAQIRNDEMEDEE
jgi:hypothetical protein